ncbi:pyruvate, phosphate dikinase [Actinomycetospora termitidis]|uniref:Pyruvate, phosphate dikinase n=1 Tax=Actinomycetospora termitidis TaxID=3053470 RepID=A0ABT7MDK6_9PSEU|nr:pyruvate, phosphate dikinase [Actinomycetospora sp. Odt1-22]MDL5158752.1 pyruvate, phosphate dikinase [Actinomycetospora sp. Odt1-22]
MTKFVYDFAEGDRDQRDLLGGKGANLAEMTNLGLPVPPGFIITTDACRAYLAGGSEPEGMAAEVTEHLTALEGTMGKRLGQADDPLLVSVRSGAKFSMPGMMETVLNVGLNDDSVHGLAAQAGDDRFAWDSYRRLVQMFGATVLDIDAEHFHDALEAAKSAKGTKNDLDLDAGDLAALVETYKGLVTEHAGRDFPQDPREQLDLAVRAVFDSWNSDRANIYRRQERIPADLGTAVSVVSMVFGNLGMDSGTGVAFTRDPASGAQGVYGDYLQNAQGEDVVAGIRNTLALTELERIDKTSYDELMRIMGVLEAHYRDLCDIEFTIERGKLWMLQTRVGKRTAAAAFTVATQLVDEGLIDLDEALQRVTGHQLAQLMFPRFDPDADKELLTTGMNASPGAAGGKAVFDSETAVAWAKRGEKVVLVRRETNPDDLAGMIAAEGILTSRGGRTSHAAVVARGMGKTAVCGAEELEVDVRNKVFTVGGEGPAAGREVREGEVIAVDGTSGEVYLGEIPVVPSPVMSYFEHGTIDDGDELVVAVDRIMRHADGIRRLRVRANADTGDDAALARRFGAEGIGLCRTEHMFLGERRSLVEDLVLAETRDEREKALAALLPMQIEDFTALYRAMAGQPVTIRLLDPPLHEFLPDLTELSVQVAVARERGELTDEQEALLENVRRLHEQNPMLGLRGVRLGIQVPGLFAMQIRAITRAAAALVDEGVTVLPEIMVPLVGTVQELQAVAAEIAEVVQEPESLVDGAPVEHQVGTMIELPRAALVAAEIAEVAQFFSFGTNDLTQTTWGFSRDDVESSFFSAYLDHGIFGVSPFESLDTVGVGELVEIASWRGREVRHDLKLGICGEHGGDPDSVHFFHRAGLDYVSCSPFRVPVARLEAGRAQATHG